jgi:hypothetical protein
MIVDFQAKLRKTGILDPYTTSSEPRATSLTKGGDGIIEATKFADEKEDPSIITQNSIVPNDSPQASVTEVNSPKLVKELYTGTDARLNMKNDEISMLQADLDNMRSDFRAKAADFLFFQTPTSLQLQNMCADIADCISSMATIEINEISSPANIQVSCQLSEQVSAGFDRRSVIESVESIKAIFDQHKDSSTNLIMPKSLGPALRCVSVNLHETEISKRFASSDLNKDGGLDLQEFSSLVAMPSPVEEWARSLPLAQIVADAMPRNDCLSNEQLRSLSKISQDQLDKSCDAIIEGVRRSLQEQLAVLKRAYEKMDNQAAAVRVSNDKFQIVSMSVGNINDFHKGLAARIGNHSLHHHVIICLCYSDTAWSGPQVNPIWISRRP